MGLGIIKQKLATTTQRRKVLNCAESLLSQGMLSISPYEDSIRIALAKEGITDELTKEERKQLVLWLYYTTTPEFMS